MKTYLYNFDPLNPNFIQKKQKLGFTWVHIISYFCSKTDCGAVLTSTHSLCFEQLYEKYLNFFYLKIFIFWW